MVCINGQACRYDYVYIKAQIKAGAKAIQIFDSWVGALNVADYRIFIKPVMTRIFAELREERCSINYVWCWCKSFSNGMA